MKNYRVYRFRNERKDYSDKVPDQDPEKGRMAQLREELSTMRYSADEDLKDSNDEILRKLHILFKK
jgi:Fe-S-cluster formation regulator IscX/YfhJ